MVVINKLNAFWYLKVCILAIRLLYIGNFTIWYYVENRDIL